MTCRGCHPELFPTGERQSPGHIAIRFDKTNALAGRVRILLNGEPINAVSEAIPGEKGTVVYYPKDAAGKIQLCRECGKGTEEIVAHGAVEVVYSADGKAFP